METTNSTNSYLMNFWIPMVGHSIRRSDSKDIVRITEGPLDNAGVQFIADGEVIFIQDYEWLPGVNDIIALCNRLGLDTVGDQLQHKKQFFPLPKTVKEGESTIRTFRQLMLVQGKDILTQTQQTMQ
jgi:hypothetical protein